MERNENETHLEKKKKKKKIPKDTSFVDGYYAFINGFSVFWLSPKPENGEHLFYIFKTGHCQVFFLENLFFRNRLPNF